MKKIKRKSLLYKSEVEYADFCINHVEGCTHDCKFPCYARLMAKRFGKIKRDSDWVKIKLVSNALELLDKEIPKFKDQIRFVHLCFMTDPFMYNQRDVRDLTLKIIEKLNKNKIRCTVLTKGIYPKSLVNKERYGYDNEYGITLVSLDNNFKRGFEPNSAPYLKRIESLKYLHNNGLKTWVSMEPYPTQNIVRQDLLRILENVFFVDKIIFGKLNYNVDSGMFRYGNKSFYQGCANIVKDFCDFYGIKHHIKYGTENENNKKTVVLFKRGESQKELLNCVVKPL